MSDIIIIPVVPIGKPRMTQRDKWLRPPRKCVQKYWEYKSEVQRVWEDRPLPTQFLDIDFFLPMPKSWNKQKKADLLGTFHDQKPDLDNLVKAFMDALIPEDKKIASLQTNKFWASQDKGCIVIKNYI